MRLSIIDKPKDKENIGLMQSYMEKKGYDLVTGLSKLATEIGGVTEAELERYFYGHSVEPRKIEKITSFVNSHIRKNQIIETSNFNTIRESCNHAKKHRLCIAQIGYPGAGKTTALVAYYKGNQDTFYLQLRSSMNRKQVLSEILRVMGIKFSGNIFEMHRVIADELNSYSNALLIIDEAGKLCAASIHDLHDIRNATMHSTGIVLAGCEYFRDNMLKYATRQRQGFPEFVSRIQEWIELNRPTKAEIEYMCKLGGITDKETVRDIQSECRDFRAVDNYIKTL